MRPSHCSVLVVDRSCTEKTYRPLQVPEPGNSRTSNFPFFSPSSDRCTCEGNNQNIDDLIKMFLKIFAEVITVPSGTRALSTLKSRRIGCPPTILLIDIDNTEGISRDLHTRRESFLAMPDAVSLQEITTTKDTLYGLELLKYISSEIAQGTLEQVIPIVCSRKDSSDIMLDCLEKGAADYLIKPIRPEVAKTIFLHAHRSVMLGNRSPITIDYQRSIMQHSHSFEQRLHDVFINDTRLTETIIEYYTPSETLINIPFFPRLNSAAELERINHLKNILTNWDFDPHKLSDEDRIRCVVIIFEHVMDLDELKELNVQSEQLHRFLLALRQSYHDTNPYHNFIHAVDVLQAMFHFLCRMALIPSLFTSKYKRRNTSNNKQWHKPNHLLRDIDVFALLLASVGHDIGHPGVNNKFLVLSQTPLARVYNDRSVLESFHAMALFNLMQKYGFNIYANKKNNPKYSEFRKVVVNAILATDMSLHNEYMGKIKKQTKRFESSDFELNAENIDQERNNIVGALIKCADISNTARPYRIAGVWSKVLLEEFRCQGDLERKLGHPIEEINDRYGSTKQSDSQISFINYFALPLFKCVGDLIPEMKFYVPYLESNKRSWEDFIEDPNDNDCPPRHNSTSNDSGVIVNLDNRQNSQIVAVPAAKTMHHQPSGTYLRPIPTLPDGPGSDRDEVVSTTEASDAPLTQQSNSRQKRKFVRSFFSRNSRQPSQNMHNIGITSEQDSDDNNIICCRIQ